MPFENSFPKETKLYKLFTTKLSEVVEQERLEGSSVPGPDEHADFMRKMAEIRKSNPAFDEIVEGYLRQNQ